MSKCQCERSITVKFTQQKYESYEKCESYQKFTCKSSSMAVRAGPLRRTRRQETRHLKWSAPDLLGVTDWIEDKRLDVGDSWKIKKSTGINQAEEIFVFCANAAEEIVIRLSKPKAQFLDQELYRKIWHEWIEDIKAVSGSDRLLTEPRNRSE